MASFSDNLRLELQSDGENPNTWGTILNDNVIKLIDSAITGYTSVHVCTGGTDVVLPLVQFNQEMLFLNLQVQYLLILM